MFEPLYSVHYFITPNNDKAYGIKFSDNVFTFSDVYVHLDKAFQTKEWSKSNIRLDANIFNAFSIQSSYKVKWRIHLLKTCKVRRYILNNFKFK